MFVFLNRLKVHKFITLKSHCLPTQRVMNSNHYHGFQFFAFHTHRPMPRNKTQDISNNNKPKFYVGEERNKLF